MPSPSAFQAAHRKRLDFQGLLERCGPEDSPASYMIRASGPDGMARIVASMRDEDVEGLVFDNEFWLRRQQIPPAVRWRYCVVLAGRGFGKTHMGAAWAISKAMEGRTNGAIIGPTASDYRNIMVRGVSGIMALSPPWFMPKYETSKKTITWPNGVIATTFSADKPDRLRGPNTGWVWGDEPCSWKHEMAAIDQIPMFNRIGTKAHPPQTLLTGTPRPLKKLGELLKKPDTVLVRGSTLANAAFLAPDAVADMRALATTRWGRQEVLGELLLDTPGAIFGKARWKYVRADPVAYAATLDRRVVAIDPAPSSETGSDESGIIVEGVKASVIVGPDSAPLKKVSVLEDASMRGSPREWAATVVRLYVKYACDTIVAEVNSGGEMVKTTIETVAAEMGVTVNVKCVRAREQKSKRAEPVSALAETERVEFVGEPQNEKGHFFPKLEAQMEGFTGVNGRRDDRCDAMCWGVHDLVFGEQFFAF